jgi:hypothetical protein
VKNFIDGSGEDMAKFDAVNWKRSNTFKGGFSSYLDGKYHDY